MTSANSGEPESVSLRKVWPDETLNFTPWLAENLHLLGEAVGMELSLVQREAYGWSGFLDILAESADRGKVVIENQLEPSDSDHLARLIGYAANHDARVLVWVAPQFHEYHQRMLGWLKDTMSGSKEIYAVEVRIERGGDLRPADGDVAALGFHPVFTAIELHSDWPSAEASRDTGQTGVPNRFYLFYKPLVERLLAADINPLPTVHGGFTGQWRSFATGYDGIVYVLGIGTGGGNEKTSVFLRVATENRQLIYDALCERKSAIQLDGAEVECWKNDDLNLNGLSISTDASVDDPEERQEETRAWMFENLPRFRAAVQPHLDIVTAELQSE